MECQPGNRQDDGRARAAVGDRHREFPVLTGTQPGHRCHPVKQRGVAIDAAAMVTGPVTIAFVVNVPLPAPVGVGGARAKHSKSPALPVA